MEVELSSSAASSPPPASSSPTPLANPPPTLTAKSLPSQPPRQAKLGPDPQAHVLYFDLVVANALTVGMDHMGCYCLSLIQVMEELFKVDNMISLFPYGLPQR